MKKVLFIILMVAVAWTFGFAADEAAEETQREFTGTAKCKMCHKKEADGDQAGKWEAGPHSKAYATLANEQSLAIAKEKGIENPQQADECLVCHVTAHGVDAKFLGKKHDVADGVGCESCHGAGGDYYSKKTMEAIFNGEVEAESVGLLTITEETCTVCHNEKSPTYKEFKYAEMLKQISHPYPEGKRPAK